MSDYGSNFIRRMAEYGEALLEQHGQSTLPPIVPDDARILDSVHATIRESEYLYGNGEYSQALSTLKKAYEASKGAMDSEMREALIKQTADIAYDMIDGIQYESKKNNLIRNLRFL